jgi:hypothetical protein
MDSLCPNLRCKEETLNPDVLCKGVVQLVDVACTTSVGPTGEEDEI